MMAETRHDALIGFAAAAVFWTSAAVSAAPKTPAQRRQDNTGMVFLRGGELPRGGKYKVTVRSFYIDRYEVTNQDYCEFLNDGNAGYWNARQEIHKADGKFVPKTDKHRWPVYCVSWPDAVAYAAWAGKRLPTEAEWEYAAAGTAGRKFPWGNEPITPTRANFAGNVGHPRPVGSYPAGKTPDGVYDMSGNVAEWCIDGYDAGYYATAPRDSPAAPAKGKRRVRRGGCFAMAAADQASAARGSSAADYRPRCIGIRCVRPVRRVLLILGENFEELELAAFTGVLSWADETRNRSNPLLKRSGGAEVAGIEVVVAGFAKEVRGMGSLRIRSDVLVADLTGADVDRFDAVAIPACVGGGRGTHTDKGQLDLVSPPTLAIVRRVHRNGGVIATMCAAASVLKAAGLTPRADRADYPLYTTAKAGRYRVLAFDEQTRTITSGGPLVAVEAACLLLKTLVHDTEYRAFRRHNPWLFGIKDEFAPRIQSVK